MFSILHIMIPSSFSSSENCVSLRVNRYFKDTNFKVPACPFSMHTIVKLKLNLSSLRPVCCHHGLDPRPIVLAASALAARPSEESIRSCVAGRHRIT